MSSTKNKKKIINDPVYGFITIPSAQIYDIIEHPYFQRLRRIKQLSLTYYVYPGAVHTRFQHVLGAMHLMQQAIDTLRIKGVTITDDQEYGALTAILLHDLGHGPFSHTLEYTFFKNITHEHLSLAFMEKLKTEMPGVLDEGIKIFTNQTDKTFLHQLVSSQLDMDRLDYLRRDSFFTGVTEGIIGADRIIKMLNMANDELVVDAKGIYSIEKFLIARRLMYWQVYLHKTVVVTEHMLIKVLKRAKELTQKGVELFAPPQLLFFLQNTIDDINLINTAFGEKTPLENFAMLDDYDVMASIKVWATHKDKVLSELSKRIIYRNLFRIAIVTEDKDFNPDDVSKIKENTARFLGISMQETDYFVFSGIIYNRAYSKIKEEQINILFSNGVLRDIAQASDISNVSALSKIVRKKFICYPKESGQYFNY